MPLLVVLAAPNEYAAALGLTPRVVPPASSMPPCGTVHSAVVCGQQVLLCRCGVGPINAGISLGAALARGGGGAMDAAHAPASSAALGGVQAETQRELFRIDGVLSIGLAGSYDLSRAPLGSVWRVREEIWPEYGFAGRQEAGSDARGLGFALWDETPPSASVSSALGDGVIWDRILLPPGTGGLVEAAYNALPTASSVTVAGASGTLGYAAALHKRYGALLENMEGFALALACIRVGLPFYEVRVVSNLAGAAQGEYRDFSRALQLLPICLRSLLRGENHAEA